MIMHLSYPFDVLGRDNSCLPAALVRDDAAKVDDPVTHDYVQSKWTPIALLQCRDNTIPDMIVIGRRIRHFAGEARNRLQEICAGHNADERVAEHDRQTFDVVLLHQLHNLCERRIFRHGQRRLRHDFAYLAALLTDEICGRFARAHQEAEPSGALFLSADLRAANEVSLGYDANELARSIN